MINSETTTNLSDTRNIFGTDNDYANMFQMIYGFKISQIVHAAASFSLAESLAAGPATPGEIASALSLDEDATFRFMRACASVGLLTYDGHSKFGATPLLNTLHKDDAGSLRGLALMLPAPCHWLPWGHLGDALKSGEPQAMATLGRSVWDYLADTPDEAAAFAGAMKSTSLAFNLDAAKLVDTRFIDIAVDIGGASGTFLHALMQENPALEGMVFDLPHVVPSAIKASEELGLQDRLTVMAGDFFSTSLPSADLFLLKLILHDWNDEACLSILKNCRRAMNPGGRILVAEMLIGEIGTPGFAPLIDLTMLVVLGGKERNLEEYKALFHAAGFRFSSARPTSTPFVLIEAVAV